MLVWIALGLVLVLLVGVYAAWIAGRLNRQHARLDLAAAALDGQLKVRARTAARFCDGADVPVTAVPELALAAELCAEANGLDAAREELENQLVRALRVAVEDPAARQAALSSSPDAVALVDAMTRAGFARRFHNDAVRDTLVVRRRWIVRLFHLAGSAPRPRYFEIDDAPLVIPDAAGLSAPYD